MKFDLKRLKKLKLTEMPNWPKQFQNMALLLALLIALFLVYFFFISNKTDTLNLNRKEELLLKHQLKTAYSTVAHLPLYQKQNIKLTEMLNKILMTTSQSINIHQLLNEISTLALRNKITIKSVSPQSKQYKMIFTILPIKINAIGSYHQLAKFITALLYSSNLITINELLITQPASHKTLSNPKITSHPLQLLTTVYVYWYVQKNADKSGKTFKQPVKTNK